MALQTILSMIPSGLTGSLESTYNEIVRNYREGRWEPAELNGGKFCEAVYTIIRGFSDGSYPNSPSKPPNMVDSCHSLQTATHVPRSIRIQIPRMLVALYEVRNNRGVGHVGGDVDPNHMDALVVLQISKWILSELIRVFHAIDIVEATQIVEAISDRTLPLIWKVNGRSRVLNPTLSFKDKTLAVLYSEMEPISEKNLFESVEHSNGTVYRKDVLVALHRSKMLEYNSDDKTVSISPIGSKHVEDNISLSI